MPTRALDQQQSFRDLFHVILCIQRQRSRFAAASGDRVRRLVGILYFLDLSETAVVGKSLRG